MTRDSTVCASDFDTRMAKHCDLCGETTVFDFDADLEPHCCPQCGERFEETP